MKVGWFILAVIWAVLIVVTLLNNESFWAAYQRRQAARGKDASRPEWDQMRRRALIVFGVFLSINLVLAFV